MYTLSHYHFYKCNSRFDKKFIGFGGRRKSCQRPRLARDDLALARPPSRSAVPRATRSEGEVDRRQRSPRRERNPGLNRSNARAPSFSREPLASAGQRSPEARG